MNSLAFRTNLKGNKFLLLILAWIFLPKFSFAQYDEYRFPQEKDEISKYRKLKIHFEDKYLENDSIKGAHIIREFDTMGRIVRYFSPYNHKFYEYDAKGRLIDYIDSARGGVIYDNGQGDFDRMDYEFEYGPDGRLSFARVAPYSLTFKYDEEKKYLFESTMIDYEQYRQRYFYFDAKGNLKEERWFYPDKSPEKTRIIFLNRNAKPIEEKVIKYYKNGGSDSEAISYRYDDKNKVLEKKTITTSIHHPDGFDSLPILPQREVDTSIYIFTYNNYGKTSETYHYSESGYNHKYEWWYTKNGLKHEENYFGNDGKLKQRSLFRYIYYNSPKKSEKKNK